MAPSIILRIHRRKTPIAQRELAKLASVFEGETCAVFRFELEAVFRSGAVLDMTLRRLGNENEAISIDRRERYAQSILRGIKWVTQRCFYCQLAVIHANCIGQPMKSWLEQKG